MKKTRLLCLMLLCGLLASCGSEGSPSTTVGNDSASNTAPESTSALDALPSADYGGVDFTIFGERQTTLSDYFDVEEQTGEAIDDAVWKRNRTVEDKYKINLVFHLQDWGKDLSTETIRTLTLAGDDTYDLFTATHLYLGSVIAENYFVDWKKIPNVNLDADWYVKNANETFSIGDNMPLLFGDFMESNILRCWHFVFNKRLADECGLEDLYKVVDEGRWTVDYLRTATKDLMRDLNGDTTPDENDFYGFATDKLACLDAFSRSLGLNAITKDKDNLPVLSYYNEKVVSAFEKVYDLYWNSVGTFVSTQSLAHINTLFAENRAVIAAFRIDQLMNAEIRNMTDDYGVLPYPKSEEGEGGYGTYLSGTFSAQMISINKPESEYAKIGMITEALNAYSQEYVTPAIYEVTLKTKTSRDERSIEMLDLILDSRQYSFDSCDESNFPLSPIKTLRTLIGGSKSKDIASYYASNENAAEEWVQTMIDAYKD